MANEKATLPLEMLWGMRNSHFVLHRDMKVTLKMNSKLILNAYRECHRNMHQSRALWRSNAAALMAGEHVQIKKQKMAAHTHCSSIFVCRPKWWNALLIPFDCNLVIQQSSFLKKNFLQLYCPSGISPMGNLGCFPQGKPAATESRYPTYCACWVFWCFHNPPNCDMDYRIFNMCTDVNVCDGTKGVYGHM